ncbi:MAG TPA: hypothetical protein VFO89_12345, partial [Thermoanaerobaculia bacterium]|nr:hypothetical protein [Thermoanaerobaculia bacterium]
VHPQRPVFARCMSCRKMLCQECATQWDGIWHCAACLGAKRGAQVERSAVLGWIVVVLSSLLFLYAGARVLVWTSALIAGLF